MDYVLDIIIPKKEIEAVKLKEKLIEWGDSVYSCSPPQYFTDSNIIFEQIEDIKYYEKRIGKEFSNEVVILNLKSDILFELEYEINSGDKKLENNKLFLFLKDLFELSVFYILLIREDERVKECYRSLLKKKLVLKYLMV